MKSRMGYCDIENFYGKNKKWCISHHYTWKIYDANFDNVFSSLLTLFVISNLEGWVEILYHAIDSNEETIVKIFLFFF